MLLSSPVLEEGSVGIWDKIKVQLIENTTGGFVYSARGVTF